MLKCIQLFLKKYFLKLYFWGSFVKANLDQAKTTLYANNSTEHLRNVYLPIYCLHQNI